MTAKLAGDWRDVATASYGNPYKNRAKVCVVATRYGGAYEGGRFAALEFEDVDSEAFLDDCAASEWWHENQSRVGIGNTPDEALQDWYQKSGLEGDGL